MAMKRLLTEFGMGSSLRRQDYTSAARKALQDALWHNSINLAELFDAPKGAMQIKVEIGVQKPGEVDTSQLSDIFPYGDISFEVREGGLDIPRPGGGAPTVIANVALSVSLDLEAVA